MESTSLVVERRQEVGKGVARRLRRAGAIPAVLYGNGETIALSLSEKDLLRIRQSEAGENALIDVVVTGEPPAMCKAILREVQVDPVRGGLLHADFYRVDMNKTLTVMVPLEFVHEPHDMLKAANAMVTTLMREVEVECLPQDIPRVLQVDLGQLHIGEALKVGALTLPPGVTLITDPEEALVTTTVEEAEAGGGAPGATAGTSAG